MNDTVIGYIRTFVPVAVGAAVTWLARELGIVIDDETSANVTVAVTGLVTAGYYAVVRIVAEKIPAVGWALGYNKKPAYNKTA